MDGLTQYMGFKITLFPQRAARGAGHGEKNDLRQVSTPTQPVRVPGDTNTIPPLVWIAPPSLHQVAHWGKISSGQPRDSGGGTCQAPYGGQTPLRLGRPHA